MVLNREIKNFIIFYKREMKKWEDRIFLTSLILLLGIVGITILKFWILDFQTSTTDFHLIDYLQYTLLSPILFYLNFSRIQYSSFKKQMNEHQSKLIELNSPKI